MPAVQPSLKPLVTHRFPLAEANEAFIAATSDPSAIKVVVRPGD